MPVKFSSDPAGLTFTPNPQTTDGSGCATVTATGPVGVYTVTATVCGILTDTWTLVIYEPTGMTAGGAWY